MAAIKKIGKRVGQPQRWTRAAFLEALAFYHSEEDAEAAAAIFDWGARWRLWWGYGRRDGSCFVMIDHGRRIDGSFALWTRGVVEMQFQHMTQQPFGEPGMRLQLLERMNTLDGVKMPEESITRRPNFPLRVLREEPARTKFFDIWTWYTDQIGAWGR